MSTVIPLPRSESFADIVNDNIRVQATLRHITQADLARALGMAQTAVSARWRGVRQWQLEDIERVAALFGLPPVVLCAARDSNPEPSDLEPGVVVDLATYRAGRAA